MNFRLAVGLTAILTSAVCQAQAPTLNLYTFDSAPYQMAGTEKGGTDQISGETVDTVVCAANRAGWSTRSRITPQNRAMHSLERNMIDGYFAIDPSTELDNIAERSDPVALEKGYFFTRGDKPFTDDLPIGVVDGSNEEAWLEANGYAIFLSVSSPSQLLALLKRGRIDTALMDERVMNRLRYENDSESTQLNAHFVRYAPLYLYLSEAFVSEYPDFLGTFNRTLNSCMAGQLALSEEETRRITELSGRLFKEMNSVLDINQIIEAGPRQESFTDVMTIDSQWQALVPVTTPDLAERILALPGSRALLAWQESHRGLVTEVMLINDMGTLAAMSQLTSDYWQGDEAKFQKTYDVSGDALFIDEPEWDDENKIWRGQVSFTITDEGKSIGAVTMEVNLTELQRRSSPGA